MKILLNNNDLNEALCSVSSLGFVPTMGSLHKGHISLIKKSLRECGRTIVSIFINPTQFNNKIDYKKYPRNNKKDLSILKKLKVDFVYLPKKNHIYNSKYKLKHKLLKSEKILCAKYRKGHFEGVIDVLDRLTNIIRPKIIWMGEKDYQQFFLVRNFIEKKYKTKVNVCKTIRDSNKAALSTRNFLLNAHNLKMAGTIAGELFKLKKLIKKNIKDKNLIKKASHNLIKKFNIKIEYLECRNLINLSKKIKKHNFKLFVAYYLSGIRLIDNF